MSDLTQQILMRELQAFQPQTVDPYGPMARTIASTPVYHQDADPWANIGASFVQSFTAGLFGELSRGRQQQIQQERLEYMLPIARQFDDMAQNQRLSQIIAEESARARAQQFGERSFLNPGFGTPTAQPNVNVGLPAQQGAQQQPLALPAGTQGTAPQNPAQMSIAAPQDPQQIGSADLLGTIGRRTEAVAGPGMAQKLAPDMLKRAENLRKSFRQIEQLTQNAEPIIESATTSGNYLAQGLDFAISQLGPGESRDRRSNLQKLNQLGSQYKRMIKNADNLTGGQMNTAAELKLIAGDAFSPDSTPEANLYALNLIRQRLPEFALEFEQITGIPLQGAPQPAPQMQSAQPEQQGTLTERDLPLPMQGTRAIEGGRASPSLVDAIINVESGGNPNAVSSKGATGLMQVMPDTAQDVQERYSIQGDFRDPETNKAIGTAYINEELGRYGGNLEISLAAYNWGRGNVDKLLTSVGVDPRNPPEGTFEAIQSRLPRETREYVPKVKAALARQQTGIPDEPEAQPAEQEPQERNLRDLIAESVTDATLKVLGSQILPINRGAAAVNAAIDTAGSGFEGFQDSYRGYRDATERAIRDLDRDIGPELATGADIAGTILDPINRVGGAPQTLKGLIARAGAEGGTFLGGRSLLDYIAGGEGTAADVVGDTVKGATIGGAGAGVIGGAAKGLGALAKTKTGQKLLFSEQNPFVRLLKSERGAVSFDDLPSEGKLYQQAKDYLTTRFRNVDPDIIESAAQEVAEARRQGVPLNLSDELLSRGSATAETLGKTTAKLSPEAADDVTRFLTERAKEGPSRVAEYVDTLSDKPATKAIVEFSDAVKSAKKKLRKARSDAAEPLYDAARQETPTIAPEKLDRILASPGGKYLKTAIKEVQDINPELEIKPQNDIDVVAEAWRYLRDTTLPELREKNRYASTVVGKTFDDLEKLLSTEAPLWAKAQDIFRNGSSDLNKISGRQFEVIEALADTNPDTLTKRLFALSRRDIEALGDVLKDDHMDAIKGMVKAHIADIAELGAENTRNVDFINNIVGKNGFPRKLRSLLGDEAEDLLSMLDRESKVFVGNQRFNNLGSPTAAYLGEIHKTAEGAVDAALDAGSQIAFGNTGGAIGAIARRLPNPFREREMPQRLSRAIAEVLFDPQTGGDAALDIAKAVRNYRTNRDLIDAIIAEGAMNTTRGTTRRR